MRVQVHLTKAMVDFGLPFAEAERLQNENQDIIARLGGQIASDGSRLAESTVGFYASINKSTKQLDSKLQTGRPYIALVTGMVKKVRPAPFKNVEMLIHMADRQSPVDIWPARGFCLLY